MKFSSQEEYGLRCLLQVARNPEDSPLTIPEISRIEGLTQTHVAKLLAILRREGFIQSTRGHSGGYILARKPAEIPISDVLEALGGKLYDSDFCNRHAGIGSVCAHDIDCSVRSIWQLVQTAVDEVLVKTTLADLLGTPKVAQRENLMQIQMAGDRS